MYIYIWKIYSFYEIDTREKYFEWNMFIERRIPSVYTFDFRYNLIRT